MTDIINVFDYEGFLDLIDNDIEYTDFRTDPNIRKIVAVLEEFFSHKGIKFYYSFTDTLDMNSDRVILYTNSDLYAVVNNGIDYKSWSTGSIENIYLPSFDFKINVNENVYKDAIKGMSILYEDKTQIMKLPEKMNSFLSTKIENTGYICTKVGMKNSIMNYIMKNNLYFKSSKKIYVCDQKLINLFSNTIIEHPKVSQSTLDTHINGVIDNQDIVINSTDDIVINGIISDNVSDGISDIVTDTDIIFNSCATNTVSMENDYSDLLDRIINIEKILHINDKKVTKNWIYWIFDFVFYIIGCIVEFIFLFIVIIALCVMIDLCNCEQYAKNLNHVLF